MFCDTEERIGYSTAVEDRKNHPVPKVKQFHYGFDRLKINHVFFVCINFFNQNIIIIHLESCDGMRRTSETAMQCGYQRRTREIADWARSKRRRYIRREDLLSYLAGKPPPSMIHVTKLPPHLFSSTKPQPHHGQYHQNQQPVQPHSDHHMHNGAFVTPNDSDLHTFKEALARRPR